MRKERSTTLVADFEETGYAKGWYFQIPSAFRLALDIQMTPRIINGISEDTWTQGESFCFSKGDLLYDTPIAYKGTWSDALRHIHYFIQVELSTPPKIIDDEVHQGTVTYKLYSPNQQRNGIDMISRHSCLQNQFVEFLKTGQLKTNDDNLVLPQKPDNKENHCGQTVLF